MSPRALILLAALAVSLAIVLAAAFLGPARNPADAPDPSVLADPARLPGGIADPQQLRPQDRRTVPLESADSYTFSRYNSRGQLVEFSGKSIRPRPDGRSDIARPVARIHLTPHRVLQITGDAGSFFAPDNIPRSGTLEGNVRLALFENQPASRRPPAFDDDSPDLALRIDLDRPARFDLELGQLDSDGHVRLASPAFDFTGTGLSLTHNARRDRIDRLEIAQGHQLRYRPATNTNSITTANNNINNQPGPSGPDSAPTPAPIYLARFLDNVRVHAPNLELQGDELQLLFAMQGGSLATTQPNPPKSAPNRSPLKPEGSEGFATDPAADTVVTWTGKVILTPLDTPLANPLATPLAADEESTPAGQPRLALLGRDAKPVTAVTPGRERIAAGSLHYHIHHHHIRALSSERVGVTLQSDHLGTLTGKTIELRPRQATGRILGPGTLVTPDQPTPRPDASAPDSTPSAAPDRLPPGTTIAWRDGVDLAFHQSGRADAPLDPGPASPPSANLAALRSAVFHGDVTIRHPELGMTGQRLDIQLDPPIHGRQTVRLLTVAAGPDQPVHVVARQSRQRSPLLLDADHLALGFASDPAGRSRPDRLTATGNVRAIDQHRALRADTLHATFQPDPKPVTTPTTGASGGSGGSGPGAASAELPVRLQKLEALGRVVVDRADGSGRATAQRLLADLPADRYELFGTPDQPARLERDDGGLAAARIIFTQRGGLLQVPGPGTLDLLIPRTPTPAPGAGLGATASAVPAPPRPDAPPADAVVLTWRQGMTFDQSAGRIDALGDVLSQSRSIATDSADISKLTCDQLTLYLASSPITLDPNDAPVPAPAAIPPLKPAASAPDPSPPAQRDLPPTAATALRDVRRAVADGNATLLAESWADQPGGTLRNRVRLQGPALDFDNTAQTLTIHHAGSLLIEAPGTAPGTAPAPAPAPAPGTGLGATASAVPAPLPAPATAPARSAPRFTGRGATLFTFQKQLVLDARHNDVLMLGGVQMVHRSEPERRVMQLDCESLRADLAQTGGLASWAAAGRSNASRPEVQLVRADGNVRVLSDPADESRTQSATADHLAYDGSTRTVVLQADPNSARLAQWTEPGQTTARSAQAFRWDLDRDRVEVVRPGPIRLVIPQR